MTDLAQDPVTNAINEGFFGNFGLKWRLSLGRLFNGKLLAFIISLPFKEVEGLSGNKVPESGKIVKRNRELCAPQGIFL